MVSVYGNDFYKDRHQRTVYSARAVLSLVLEALPPVHSAVDLGCGVGTWLAVLKEKGVDEVLGLDGSWVAEELLEIPKEQFRQVDFEKPVVIQKKYDLAISLEVAEHIPESRAEGFVNSLVTASDFVLFSAAIPFQDGRNHVNEQWQDYWAEIFAAEGYVALDIVRRDIWNDSLIPFWYRQNTVLYAKENRSDRVRSACESRNHGGLPISLVHPDMYLRTAKQVASLRSVRGSWRAMKSALSTYFKRKYLRVVTGNGEKPSVS
jgi:SAM-dependent methyltransferase